MIEYLDIMILVSFVALVIAEMILGIMFVDFLCQCQNTLLKKSNR